MDLGGRSANVDLSEAPRVVLPSSTPSSLPNSAQIQPPHFSMIMQQAVAMQQFQFQQALLMQQVMATQQAAARAANVKSATEMAAARAAEISKQLKGSDAEEEPVTTSNPAAPSPNRSRSPSISRSASRSKSHSPIRYRRDRSVSRSPIRYRRDRVSPLRSRDHYGYRGRSRRGYYRGGRGDYLWNPYRRDWDRDYYPRSRRSRSRSRSRVKRRSRTRSCSPWSRREQTLSPRNHRDDRTSARNTRRFRSKEAKRSPSGSSRGHSSSPCKKEQIRSPGGEGGAAGVPKDEMDEEKKQSPSPVEKTGCLKINAEAVDKVDLSGQGICRDGSVSPICSLSVSLSPLAKLRRIPGDNAQTKLKGQINHEDMCLQEQFNNSWRSPKEFHTDSYSKLSERLAHEGNGSKISLRLKGYKQDLSCRQGRGLSRAEHSGKEADYESEDDRGVDDWRDDMKIYGREKVLRAESKDSAQKLGEPKVRHVCDQSFPLTHSRIQPASQQGDSPVDELRPQEISPEAVDYEGLIEQHNQSLPRDCLLSAIRGSPGRLGLYDREQEESTKGRGKESLSTTQVLANEFEAGNDNEMEDQLVFEGPNPACESYAASVELPEVPSLSDSGNALSGDYVNTKSTESEADRRKYQKAKHLQPLMYENEGLHVVKTKGRSRSREDRRHKEVDWRKERHGKHKRKIHRGEVVFDEDEDECEEELDVRKEKRKHRKKLKREEDETRKERKKKKYKHRSPRLSMGVGATEATERPVSPVVRKKNSARRKRSRCSSKCSHMSATSSD